MRTRPKEKPEKTAYIPSKPPDFLQTTGAHIGPSEAGLQKAKKPPKTLPAHKSPLPTAIWPLNLSIDYYRNFPF
jgi:hypothetical protein